MEHPRIQGGLSAAAYDPSPDLAAGDFAEDLGGPLTLAFLRSLPDCVKLLNLDGRLEFMNHNGQCAMEIDDLAQIKGKSWWSLWPEAGQPVVQQAVERARGGEIVTFTAPCPTGRGSLRMWEVRVCPVREPNGEIRSLLSISRDVTV
jgi:PAS domain S-box-containing protein